MLNIINKGVQVDKYKCNSVVERKGTGVGTAHLTGASRAPTAVNQGWWHSGQRPLWARTLRPWGSERSQQLCWCRFITKKQPH